MTTVEQTVSVSGDSSTVTTVAGSLIQAETVIQQATNPSFVKPRLDHVTPPRYISPQPTPQFFEQVRREHLIVFGGDLGTDKAELARHVAWYVQEQLQTEMVHHNGEISILEWTRQDSLLNLDLTFQEHTTSTIFVLTQVAPQDVRYDLSRVQRDATQYHHYVVASTDTPLAAWKLSSAATYWPSLSAEMLYTPNQLADVLIQGLEKNREALPLALRLDDFDPDRSFIGKWMLRDVAVQLRTPEKITVFVQLLCAHKTAINKSTLHELVEIAQDNEQVVKQWFHAILSSREQMLALGLALFDGFFDDQFFTAFEQLVEHTWHRREPSLRGVDYCDLDNLRNFFNLVDSEAYGTIIESRLSHLRLLILNVAWNSHRRQILASMPILSKLVEQSVARRSEDTDLYGSRDRRMKLRLVVGDTLSDIGVIAGNVVQGPLLRLAVDDDVAVQMVAARAMARWREFDHEKQLFETLQRWQAETRLIDIVDMLLPSKESQQREQLHAHIRATVALTVRYAALYDAPNTLADGLCHLIEELAKDHHPLVRHRFGIHTLPFLIQLHGARLRSILRDMTIYPDLSRLIAASLAATYRRNATEVMQTLALWHNECSKDDSVITNLNGENAREKLLATIAYVYGDIEYNNPGPLTADEAFIRLRMMLETEQHPLVRNAVVLAIAQQARKQFDVVEPLLRNVIAVVTKEERGQIVEILTAIYLDQREQLPGGDGSVTLNERHYPIWIIAEQRPQTSIEQAMTHWIKDPEHKTAQQIATQALVAFVKVLDAVERQRAAQIVEEQRQNKLLASVAPSTAISTTPAVITQQTPGFFEGALIPWLATFGFAEMYRPIVRGLLPEVLNQNRNNKTEMRSIVDRWRHAVDTEVQTIAAILGRALFLVNNSLILFLVVGGLFFCILCSLLNAIRR